MTPDPFVDRLLDDASLIEMAPDDILVLQSPAQISPVHADRLKQRLADYFPDHRCLVLSQCELKVLREVA